MNAIAYQRNNPPLPAPHAEGLEALSRGLSAANDPGFFLLHGFLLYT